MIQLHFESTGGKDLGKEWAFAVPRVGDAVERQGKGYLVEALIWSWSHIDGTRRTTVVVRLTELEV